MQASAKQRTKFTHDVTVRSHELTADEPEEQGGEDLGPSPQELLAASLASKSPTGRCRGSIST